MSVKLNFGQKRPVAKAVFRSGIDATPLSRNLPVLDSPSQITLLGELTDSDLAREREFDRQRSAAIQVGMVVPCTQPYICSRPVSREELVWNGESLIDTEYERSWNFPLAMPTPQALPHVVASGSWVYASPGNHDLDIVALRRRERDLQDLVVLASDWVFDARDEVSEIRGNVYLDALSALGRTAPVKEEDTPAEALKALRLAFQLWVEGLIRAVRLEILSILRRILKNQFDLTYVVIQRVWHLRHGAHPPLASGSCPINSPGACLA